MSVKNGLNRRQFIENMGATVLGVALTSFLFACGFRNNTGKVVTGGNCANGTAVAIASNHGHVLTVSAADIAAGVQKVYDIQGTAGHTHSVTLTASDFALLATNVNVLETTTSTLSHTHDITVNCVSRKSV